MFAVQKALDEKGGDGPAVLPHHLASFTGVNKVYVSLSFIITKYSINYIRLKMPLMIALLIAPDVCLKSKLMFALEKALMFAFQK